MRPRKRIPLPSWLVPLALGLALAGCAAGGGDDFAGGEAGVSVPGAPADSLGGPPVPLRALLVVAQENERGVAFLNADERRVIALTRVGWTPREIAVSPDRTQVYVVNYSGDRFGAGSISILSTSGRREIDRLDLYPYGAFHGLVPGRNGVDLYVASETRRSVLRVNLASRQIERTWVLPHGSPHMVALDRTETRLYVTDATGPFLYAINLATGELQEARVGEGPEAVVLSPDASALWVANRGDGTISVLDPYTLSTIATFGAGKDPVRIAFDDDMRRAVVVNEGEASLMVFDARTHARLMTIPVGNDPLGLALEPDGSRAYVASTRDNEVAIVDLATNTVTGTVRVGLQPSGMALVDMTR
jgi:YVTN family beta-propeller protein